MNTYKAVVSSLILSTMVSLLACTHHSDAASASGRDAGAGNAPVRGAGSSLDAALTRRLPAAHEPPATDGGHAVTAGPHRADAVLPRAPLRETSKPLSRVKYQAKARGVTVRIGWRTGCDEEDYRDGLCDDPDTLTVTRGGRTFDCGLVPETSCSKRLEVQRKGSVVLACVPWAATDDSCISDSGSPMSSEESCVLVDLNKRACHGMGLFPFVSLRSASEIDVVAENYGGLPRVPANLDELVGSGQIRCPTARFVVSRFPTLFVRAELDYDGTFSLRRVSGSVPYSDETAPLDLGKAKMGPLDVGCPKPAK